MKKLLIYFFITLGYAAQSQDYPKMARDFQQQYKDDEVAIIESNGVYEFSKGTKAPVKVAVSVNKKLLSLRYNEIIYETEWYNQNLQIEKFYASSNLKQKAGEESKVCGAYTSEGLFYDDGKFCTYPLKLKELGEVWDVTTTKRFDDSKYFTSVFFQNKYPVKNEKITFLIPLDIEVEIKEFNLTGYSISKSEKTEGGKLIIEYTAKELAGRKREDFDRGDQYTRPHLLILVKSIMQSGKKVNVLASPQDLYDWCSGLTQQLKPNPQLFKATVSQLVQDKKTDEEKVKAIYYWVQDNIRYIAFEDGIAAFKPSEAQDVFEKRYGDCKGMANLTKEMLKVAGFDARLTWIGTRRIMYDHSLPSLAVNNHMICTLLLNGKKYYLDATEKYVPFGENAVRIQGQSVMIENGDKFILDRIGEPTKSIDSDNRVLQASIKGENLEGKLVVDLKGEAKKNFLYTYHYTKSEKREEYVTDFIANGNRNLKATEVKLPDLNERSGPLSLTCDVTFNGAVSAFNNEYYIDIDPSKSFKDWEIKDTRQNDVDFGERVHKKTSIELSIPDGFSVSHLPEMVSISDSEFSFSMNYKQTGDKIIYTKELVIPDGIIKKKSFAQWNAAVKQLAQGYENQIVLKK
ncbi:MAG TPA: transglutaminase domain-containing protein [Chryseolinea sp.]|nr:transglutaminase domain-containing protein [Chryseolinea sp.]